MVNIDIAPEALENTATFSETERRKPQRLVRAYVGRWISDQTKDRSDPQRANPPKPSSQIRTPLVARSRQTNLGPSPVSALPKATAYTLFLAPSLQTTYYTLAGAYESKQRPNK
ncbi:unnamed protein product, partial [Penicillium palitans]